MLSAGSATIPAVALYLEMKSRWLPSESDVREEIRDRLSGEHEIPTPLAARRYEEIDWKGDLHFTIDVEVSELKKRRKWLPRQGFTGKTQLVFDFHEREAPSEQKLYDSFLGSHGQFEQINRHIDKPSRLSVRLNTADPNTVCEHIFGTFKRIIMEIELRNANPLIDEEWLTHPKNTYLGYKNGDLYDIMDERVALHLLQLADQEPPENIPRKTAEAGR